MEELVSSQVDFFGVIAGNSHLGGHLALHLSGVFVFCGVFVFYCIGIGSSLSCWDESIPAEDVM